MSHLYYIKPYCNILKKKKKNRKSKLLFAFESKSTLRKCRGRRETKYIPLKLLLPILSLCIEYVQKQDTRAA